MNLDIKRAGSTEKAGRVLHIVNIAPETLKHTHLINECLTKKAPSISLNPQKNTCSREHLSITFDL